MGSGLRWPQKGGAIRQSGSAKVIPSLAPWNNSLASHAADREGPMVQIPSPNLPSSCKVPSGRLWEFGGFVVVLTLSS